MLQFALEGVLYEPRGRGALRNVREPVELFAAVRAGESHEQSLPCDPVCRMAVDPERSAGRLTYEDTAYFFCSLACDVEFARQPERAFPTRREASPRPIASLSGRCRSARRSQPAPPASRGCPPSD
jgi:YHS domain-containing protein